MSNLLSNTLSAFAIEGSGALTELPGSPVGAGLYPVWPIFHPSGKFLYVNNYRSGDISAFAVDAPGGVLTPIAGSPFRAGSRFLPGSHPREPIIDPSGRFLYSVNREADTVSAYAIDSSSGRLTALIGSPFPPHGIFRLGYFFALGAMVLKSFRPARA